MLALLMIVGGILGAAWSRDAYRRRRLALSENDAGTAQFEAVNLVVGALTALAALILLLTMGRPA